MTSEFRFTTAELVSTDFVDHEEVELGRQPAHVITMLHGIRDSGIWALDLQHTARKSGLNVLALSVSYGWVGAFPFLLRLGARSIERRVLEDLNAVYLAYPDATHSLFAHSNGTKIISELAMKLDFKYTNVILSGSICRRIRGLVAPENARNVVNDCSPIDVFPVLAEMLNPWHYEATGTYGFRRLGVEDRFFTVSHGGCLTANHFKKFVLPIILSNTLKLGEKPRSQIPYGMLRYTRIVLFTVTVLVMFWIL